MKSQFIAFIQFVFLVALLLGAFFLVILGDRLGWFYELMKALVSVVVFAILFYIQYMITHRLKKSMEKDGSTDFVLYLKFKHKMIADLITYLVPILFLIFAYLTRGQIDVVDIVGSLFFFVTLLLWHRRLFKLRG